MSTAVVSAVWRKGIKSHANGDCVEVADLNGAVGIRDSKDKRDDFPVLAVRPSEWISFLSAAKNGAFELS